ncbi:MAG: hypothetical protein MUE32_11055 [Bacteroidales bacterium]|jgi:hypothetical protein|nr:hypothetical protein [Bacteroidales bacterium]
MTFNNFKNIISLRIKLFAISVILIAYLILVYAAEIIKFPIFGLSDTVVTLILVALYLFLAFLPMYLNYQYVSYSDEGDKISFRYFTAGIIGGRKNSLEIDKKSFAGFSVESRFFGLKKGLILYQNFREGKAKYPPVYISGLKKKERQKIFWSLKQHLPES